MKNLKKCMFFLLVISICFSFIGCSSKDDNEEKMSDTDIELITETKNSLEPYFEVMGVDVTDGNPNVTDDFINNINNVHVMGIDGTVEHGWNDVDGRQIIELLTWTSNVTCTHDEFEHYLELLDELFESSRTKGDYEHISNEVYEWTLYDYDYSAISWYDENRIKISWEMEKESSSDDESDIDAPVTSTYDNSSNKRNCEVDGCYNEGIHSYEGISGQTEYYCQTHYDELIGLFSDMEEDVSDSAYSKHTCEVCSKEGTRSIIGFSGNTEYYCTEHYSEMKDMMDMMLQ